MTATRIEVWVWVLVYAGLLVFGLGLAVRRSDDSFGWGIAGVGALLVAAGALLVWIRSRMNDDDITTTATDRPQPGKPAP
jgi:hypothetical protein